MTNAKNFLYLYKYLIKPYFEKYKNEFAKHSERLSRLFHMNLKDDPDKDVEGFKGMDRMCLKVMMVICMEQIGIIHKICHRIKTQKLANII